MVGQLIRVNWKQTFFDAGWVVPLGNAFLTLMLSRRRLSQVPHNLRDPKLHTRFEQLISGTPFLDWWNQTCGATGDKLFLLRFPSGVWSIPWELLIERLNLTNNQATVCLARTILEESSPLLSPSIFDEPLRILILKGACNGLDLDGEVARVQSAWRSLELSVQQCIQEPIVEQSTRESVPILLKKYTPHIVWFSGHGRLQPDVALLFADGIWINASDFSKIIQDSGHHPLYAVFWACDTGGEDTRQSEVYCSPPLFKELKNIGVLAVLAMQSPIRDSSSLLMAQHLFRFLAVGLPLERAVARCRAYFMENPPDGAHPLDWASPVTWSAGIPSDKLQWNSNNSNVQRLAQYQVLGRYALSWGQVRPQQLDATIEASERARANEWGKRSLTWVYGDIGEAEYRYYWLRILQAIQSQKTLFVIAVEMDASNPAESLQNWARNVYHRMLPGDFPDKFAQILDEIVRAPIANWRKLCELGDIYLAIANPPTFGDNWFWRPLRSNSENLHIAVLSEQEITSEIQSSWELERIDQPMQQEEIKTVVSRVPRLARALAMLNMPLRTSHLSIEVSGEEGASSLLEWPDWERVMINTSAGPIMTASARQYVLNEIPSDQVRKEANLDCVKILGNPELTLTPAIRQARLKHLLAAGLDQEALLEASSLCYIFRNDDRPFSVLQVLESLGNLQTYLPMNVYLIAAWANLQLGRVQHSEYWLQRSQPKEPLDIAWKHCLRAELYKSSGTVHSKEDALREVDEAIRICQEAEKRSTEKSSIRRRTLAYRQDKARIIHFLFYALEQAAIEYDSLVKEWSEMPNSAIDLAIVKRNYAECLYGLATGSGDARWQKARDLLQDAEELVQSYPHTPVLSEILYEEAKVAEKEGRQREADTYLDKCMTAALRSHHFMMLAIGQARAFWKKSVFSTDRWSDIESALKGFPDHGWAVRVLIDGRLRAARILEEKQDYSGSFDQLKANMDDLKRNPSFDKGSDRLRIAATMAGLQLIGEKVQESVLYWQEFLSQYSWAKDWLQEHSIDNAENFWKGGI
jgi:hypothetical protein